MWPRLLGTFFIWMMFAIITTSGTMEQSDNPTGMLAIVAAVTLISTLAIWLGSPDSSSAQAQKTTSAPQSLEKAKRGDRSRITRLADVLEEDEAAELLEELQARLSVHNDGEVISLDSLLAEREAQQKSTPQR